MSAALAAMDKHGGLLMKILQKNTARSGNSERRYVRLHTCEDKCIIPQRPGICKGAGN